MMALDTVIQRILVALSLTDFLSEFASRLELELWWQVEDVEINEEIEA